MFPYTIGKNTNPYYESQHGANNIIYEVHVTPMYNELSFLFFRREPTLRQQYVFFWHIKESD